MYNPFYNRKLVGKNLVWLLALTVLCKATGGNGFIVMVPAAMWCLMVGNNVSMLFILFMTVCGMVTNSYFMPKTVLFGVADKGVLMLMATCLSLTIFGRRQSRLLTPLMSLVPYLLFMAAVSQVGWCPIISNLKLLLFTMSFFAFYGGAMRSMGNKDDEVALRSMMLAVMIYYIGGSLVTLRMGGIGYMAFDELKDASEVISLFKGMANHSQALGPLMAVFGTFVFADWMFSIQKKDKIYLALTFICPFLIWKTSSRTALVSYLMGIMMVTYLMMKSRKMKRRWRQKVMNTLFLLGFLGLFASIAVPQVREKIERYIVKYGDRAEKAEISSATIWSSRAKKHAALLENWEKSPYIGNGFQVAADMSERRVTSVADILTAPVEKCTWTYAILEEGGVMGMGLFAIFLLTSLGLFIKRKAFIGASMLFVVMMINFGEFTIFSMSALGGVFWFMIFLGLVFDHKRAAAERRAAEIAAEMEMAGGGENFLAV